MGHMAGGGADHRCRRGILLSAESCDRGRDGGGETGRAGRDGDAHRDRHRGQRRHRADQGRGRGTHRPTCGSGGRARRGGCGVGAAGGERARGTRRARALQFGRCAHAAGIRADIAAAEAGLQTAQANQDQVALQQRQIDIAAADVKQQEAALQVAEVTLAHTLIRAPIAGTVVELPIKAGELMQPGSVIARITRLDALYVKAQIDEVDLRRLQIGQRADVEFDTKPHVKYAATLFELSPAVSVEKLKSRNVTVKLRLAQPPPFLRPGMSADVEIIVDTLNNVLMVPAQTVMSKDKERFVYVLDDGEVVRRIVETGRSNWDYTEVLKGLNAGDAVVVSLDKGELKPGVRARSIQKSSAK